MTGQFSGIRKVADGQFVEGDFRVRHKDGSWRCLHLRCTVFSRNDNGDVREILGTAQDVTERKLAEDRLTESQNRYALATGAGGVSVWDYDLGTGEIYCDSTLAHILGFAEDEKQNADWLQVIHPDDKARVLSHGRKALVAKTPIDADGNSPVPEIEYRALHKDGSILWFLNRATILRSPKGRPYRIIGTITDITARKRAELELNSKRETLRKTNRQVKRLVGKLLLAQEEERKRISRELHDGVNQQIAALGISLSKLKAQLSGGDPSVSSQIANLESRILDASDSIRELSHRLHSSLLQHVGLVSALKSHCDDVSRDEGVRVSLSIHGETFAISPEVSLCVYRITQESLRNVVKYSGAKTAEVTLAFTPGRLMLSVIDFGVGFDVQQTKNEVGLGLISIEERAAQLKGSAQIISSPGKGTKILVELPIGGHNERH
jgi:PAS domain S-box-containing protein